MSVLTTITQSTANVTKGLSKFLSSNSPTIKTIVGMIGAGATAVETGRATWKTKDILDNLPEGTDTVEKVKKVAPLWVEPVAILGVTETCIFSANRENAKRIATLAAGYAAAEAKNQDFDIYKEKVKETIGEKKEAAIEKDIYAERVAANPPVDGVNVFDTGTGNSIIQDVSFTGNYIRGSLSEIERILNKMNVDILDPDSCVEYSAAEVLDSTGFINGTENSGEMLSTTGWSRDNTGMISWITIPVPHPTAEGEYVTGLALEGAALYYNDEWPKTETEKYKNIFSTY